MSKTANQKILWIADPFESLAPHLEDTTLRLMEESIKLGHQNTFASIHSLEQNQNLVTVMGFDTSTSPTTRIAIKNPQQVDVKEFDQIHYRIDPPVDLAYLHPLQMLNQALGKKADQVITNSPTVLFTVNEKFAPLSWPKLSPRSWVGADWDEMVRFGKSLGKTVMKPLHSYQSKGIELLDWSDIVALKRSQTLLDQATQGFKRPILLQEFMNEIKTEGEIRVWFVDGKSIGAVRKTPPPDDFRISLDRGSKVVGCKDSELPQAAVAAVAKFLKAHKVRYSAVDFIGGKISDLNITCPGLLIEMEKVLSKNLATLCF